MTRFLIRQILLAGFWMLLVSSATFGDVQRDPPPKAFPFPERLEYHVEWRLITAGIAKIDFSPAAGNNWQTKLDLESAGMVTKMYRVNDTYRALTNDRFCGINSSLDAQEGKRHRFTTLIFDTGKHKLQYQERDFVKNTVTSKELELSGCTHEILGALAALRVSRLDPGKSVNLPVSNGKKTVMARIEAQERQEITIDKRSYHTVRYEAFLFDNVLYQRKGRLWLWMTDDPSRVPVQIQVRLGFPVGNITLTLDKQERT